MSESAQNNHEIRAGRPEGREFETYWLDDFVQVACATCGKKGCSKHNLSISGACHGGQPVRAEYLEGFLYLTCSICNGPVFRIPVPSKVPALSQSKGPT